MAITPWLGFEMPPAKSCPSDVKQEIRGGVKSPTALLYPRTASFKRPYQVLSSVRVDSERLSWIPRVISAICPFSRVPAACKSVVYCETKRLIASVYSAKGSGRVG